MCWCQVIFKSTSFKPWSTKMIRISKVRNKQPHTYARLCDFIFFKSTTDESENCWFVQIVLASSMSEFKVKFIVIANVSIVLQIIRFITIENIKPCLTDVKPCIYVYAVVSTEAAHDLATQRARGIISYSINRFHPAYQYIRNTRRIEFFILVVNLYGYLCWCSWQHYKIRMRA